MFKIMFRRTGESGFERFKDCEWYLARDAALYADAIADFCISSQVCDLTTGRVVYEATTGEWLDKTVS